MSLDSALLLAFLATFLRTSAMLIAAPLFSGIGTPITVRVMFALAFSFALAPLLYGVIPVPNDLYDLLAVAAREIAAGLLLGACVQLILVAAEIAGSFLDMQIGIGLASMLAPNNAVPSSVISRFKFMLALVLLVCLNGHHLLIQSLVATYGTTFDLSGEPALAVMISAFGKISLLALQIAAPVAAVAFVIDATLAIISRAVPQINVLMAGIGGKLLVGMIALSVALPSLAAGVSLGIEIATDSIQHLLAK